MDREEILKILSSYDLTKEEIEYLYLQLYFAGELNNKADDQILELHKEQKENRDSILNEIAKIMLSYPIIESIMSIANSDKLKLKKQLNTLIQNKIQSELNYETLKTKELLESTGKNKYNINNYINDIGMNVNWDIKPVEDKILDKIINDKVENKTWSDRIWENKNELQKDLKEEIKDFLNGKTTVNEIEEKIKKKYNENAYETKRLVHTEIARVQESINQKWAKEHGVKYQLFMATLDYKTSQKCRSLDGKVFEFDNVNKPIPPLHPFCRSTLVNIPNKDWRPSKRLDNVTKEKVDWQTFEEWMKNGNEKSNYLRVSNSKDVSKEDLTAIENDLNMLPTTHRKILDEYVKEIKVVSTETSSFNRKTRVVTILKDMEKGELIHELGHALETKFDLKNNEKYQKLLNNLVKNKNYNDIIYDTETFNIPIYILKDSKLISYYQGRLYKSVGIFDKNMNINIESLGEYFSEGYKEYILNPSNLKSMDNELFNFIEELI